MSEPSLATWSLTGAPSFGLNRFLAAARPSATYQVMDRVAAKRASGAQVISLSAGEPDFDTPMHMARPPICRRKVERSRDS